MLPFLTAVWIAHTVAGVLSQAIIGDRTVILGISEQGILRTPYEKVRELGLPEKDPSGLSLANARMVISLRNPSGTVTSIEDGRFSEGWGAGIRSWDTGKPFVDACGSVKRSKPEFLRIQTVKFAGENGDEDASSTVLCGAQQLLWVRHQYRPGRCDGMYEVKVTVENLSCLKADSVVYRRVTNWAVRGGDVVTIQGSKNQFVDFANGDGFCQTDPRFPCARFVLQGDFKDERKGTTGSAFQFDIGELKPFQRAVFRVYYGFFETERAAESCLEESKASVFSLSQREGEPKGLTFAFGFNPTMIRYESPNPGKCVHPKMENGKPVSFELTAAEMAAEADQDDTIRQVEL